MAPKKLLRFSDELERNNYIEALAEKYGIGYEAFRKKVNQKGISLGGVAPTEKPKDLSGRSREKEEGMDTSQKLLLTWMISDPEYFRVIQKWIAPEDFTVSMYRRVAQMLYEQHRQGKLNPAAIIDKFADAEEQRQVAAVFNATLKRIETKEETEKALQETIFKVRQNALAKETAELDPTDMMGLQRLVQRKRELEKLHISLD